MTQFFGIIEPLELKAIGQNHRSGDNGSSQRAASGFIDTCHGANTPEVEFLFMKKRGARITANPTL